MATIIESLIVTLGIDASDFEEGSEKAKKTQADLTNETEKGTKKMTSGFAAVRRELLLLASAFFAVKSVASFFGGTIANAANLGYLSENLGITTERINAFQRASERMGGSAEGATAQLKESVDTLAQLRSGLGPNEALQWFFRMGGSSADLKDGNTYLLARSKIIHDIFQTDPGKAALMAKQMGILDDQFDLIKQGPEAVNALTDAQEKNSAITAQNAKDAQELLRRWLDFTDAIKGTFMKAVLALAPAITMILEKFVEWADEVASNKDAIEDLGRSFTDFLKNTDWSGIIADAKEFAASVKDISGSIKDLIDRWDEWRGKPKVQTPGVTYLPGNIRLGKQEDVEADDRARGKETPKRRELEGWKKDYVEGLDKGLENTAKAFKPLAESDHPIIDAFTGGWLNRVLRELANPRRPGDPEKVIERTESTETNTVIEPRNGQGKPALTPKPAESKNKTLASPQKEKEKVIDRERLSSEKVIDRQRESVETKIVDRQRVSTEKTIERDKRDGDQNFSFGAAFIKALKEVLSPNPRRTYEDQNRQLQVLPFDTLMDQSKYAVSKLVAMGWSQAQASGMVGSLIQESQLNPSAVNPESGAYGIAQWLSKDRIANFEKWARRPLKGSSFDQQLEFMNYEMTKGSESKAGDAIKKTKTPERAAELHRSLYERPGEDEANDKMRRAYARQIEQSIQQSNAAASTRVPAGPAASVMNKIDNSKSSSATSTSTSDTKIYGGVNIYTQATDAKGIAKEIAPGIERYNSTMQANTGIK